LNKTSSGRSRGAEQIYRHITDDHARVVQPLECFMWPKSF
jgi:hypothetical protein